MSIIKNFSLERAYYNIFSRWNINFLGICQSVKASRNIAVNLFSLLKIFLKTHLVELWSYCNMLITTGAKLVLIFIDDYIKIIYSQNKLGPCGTNQHFYLPCSLLIGFWSFERALKRIARIRKILVYLFSYIIHSKRYKMH